MKKRKVLIITESIGYGGLNIASVEFERYLSKEKYDFTYCVRRTAKGELEQEVLDRGIRVIHVPDEELNYLKSYRFYKNLMSKEHFDIVHCHLPFFSGIVLMAAYKCGVNKRIAHAHFSQPYTDTDIYSKPKQIIAKYYRMVMRLLLKSYCNVKLACSKESGEYLFGKKVFDKNGIVLKNGINTDKFLFNPKIRNDVRKELGLTQDAFVLGNIGQLYSVKNQSFIIDVFNELRNSVSNSFLLLIGNGNDRDMLISKTKLMGLENDVLFLGLRNDAYRLYQAMDCFALPSLHEGFPLTLIEAQTSKLPCVISSGVNRLTKLNDNVEFLSLDLKPAEWAKTIIRISAYCRCEIDNSKVIKEYDVRNIAEKLDSLYSE